MKLPRIRETIGIPKYKSGTTPGGRPYQASRAKTKTGKPVKTTEVFYNAGGKKVEGLPSGVIRKETRTFTDQKSPKGVKYKGRTGDETGMSYDKIKKGFTKPKPKK